MSATVATTTSNPSLLLWLLAAAVAMLACHVFLAAIRQARRESSMRQAWAMLLAAAAALGTGICSAVVLSLSAVGLSFPIGYPLLKVFMLWGLAMLGCLPASLWLWRKQGLLAALGNGLLLAGVATGVQAGWVMAAGFRPGVVWRVEFLSTAVVLLILGATAGLRVAFAQAADEGRRRQLWRLGGALLFGMALIVGQEILIAGLGLAAQVGSIHHNAVPAFVLALVAGVLLPLVLSALAFDLELRRHTRRHRRHGSSANFKPHERPRRQHRHRQV